jgi:hypothetical protein
MGRFLRGGLLYGLRRRKAQLLFCERAADEQLAIEIKDQDIDTD